MIAVSEMHCGKIIIVVSSMQLSPDGERYCANGKDYFGGDYIMSWPFDKRSNSLGQCTIVPKNA